MNMAAVLFAEGKKFLRSPQRRKKSARLTPC
jgi:hypothetical protein